MEGNWARAWGVQGISAGSVSVALIGASGGGPGEGGASAISAAVRRMCSWVLAKVPGDMGGGAATYSATAKGTGADAADDDGSATRAGIRFFLRFAKQGQPPNEYMTAVEIARRQQPPTTLQTMMMMSSIALSRLDFSFPNEQHALQSASPSLGRPRSQWSSSEHFSQDPYKTPSKLQNSSTAHGLPSQSHAVRPRHVGAEQDKSHVKPRKLWAMSS